MFCAGTGATVGHNSYCTSPIGPPNSEGTLPITLGWHQISGTVFGSGFGTWQFSSSHSFINTGLSLHFFEADGVTAVPVLLADAVPEPSSIILVFAGVFVLALKTSFAGSRLRS